MFSDVRKRANGTGAINGEGSSHSRSALVEQEVSGSYPATARNRAEDLEQDGQSS